MPSRTELIEQLFENFKTIRRGLVGQRDTHTQMLHHITSSQWGVLRIAAHQDTVSVKEIASQLHITSSAATQLVDGLVKNGHLKRTPNPLDRRSQCIALSVSSKKQMRMLRKYHLQSLSKLFSALTETELQQYLRLSNKVTRSLTPQA
jgi:DNA-binding MarR family transcriptional regulator